LARITSERNVTAVLDAAASWIDKCLVRDGSQLSDEALWTKPLVQELRAAFVEQPDLSKDKSFAEKLSGQLDSVSPEAKRLAAEMLWALRLFPTNIRPRTKRDSVLVQWATSGANLDKSHPLLTDQVLQGIGSAGQGFNQHFWKELAFLIELTDAVKSMQPPQRRETLTNYDKFLGWIDSVPQEGYRQFRHMLRYFAFPDRVEGIVSGQHLRSILAGFDVAPESNTTSWSDRQFDEALLALRTRLEQEHPGRPLSFYHPPLKQRWRPDEVEEQEVEEPGAASPALMIWVGKDAAKNYQVGMESGIWGFPNLRADYSKVRRGTYIVFGRMHSDGSPRVSKDDWAQGRVSEVTLCRVVREFWQDDTPHWPDENTGEARYPHRIGIEPVRAFKNVSAQSQVITSEAFEGLRLSALGQGKGVLVERAVLSQAGDESPSEAGSMDDESEFNDEAAQSFDEVVDLRPLVPEFKKAVESARLVASQKHLLRLVAALMAKRFLLLTGLAGSGKTKLAEAFGRWITRPQARTDPFAAGTRIVSDRKTYIVKQSDNLSVEFWNADAEDDATKVSLPREMIQEWATYIARNSVAETSAARAIREAVKVDSKFSDQLHSFETHLKAAAFALLKFRRSVVSSSGFELIPIGADWTGNENILGYPDGLDSDRYVSKPALRMILSAAKSPRLPHVLILDEMNLSHVERYFADILSLIESGGALDLYTGDMGKPATWRKDGASTSVPPRLAKLPTNLFIIGTVNVDETTYMFSPKVLDRASVIEFRMSSEEIGGFLQHPVKPDLATLDGTGASFGPTFVHAADQPSELAGDMRTRYEAEMLLFFQALQPYGAEFGYRTAHEAGRFLHFYDLLSERNEAEPDAFSAAFDCVIFQRLLPKLHGSRAKLGPLLKKLWFLCTKGLVDRTEKPLVVAEEASRSTDKRMDPTTEVPSDAPYPMSAEKVARMWRLLNENGFTSFAEA